MATFFVDENTAQGIRRGGQFEAGVSDIDPGRVGIDKFELPYFIDKRASYLDYQCWIDSELDSGIVTHRQLPQEDDAFDTLGSATVPELLKGSIFGINTKSVGKFRDVVQRMAHSVYHFALRGWAVRAAYQPTIPFLKSVAGVPAIPNDEKPQKVVGPILISNCGGVPVYYSAWELWYTTAQQPKVNVEPPENISQFIKESDKIAVIMPVSAPDGDAESSGGNVKPIEPIPV